MPRHLLMALLTAAPLAGVVVLSGCSGVIEDGRADSYELVVSCPDDTTCLSGGINTGEPTGYYEGYGDGSGDGSGDSGGTTSGGEITSGSGGDSGGSGGDSGGSGGDSGGSGGDSGRPSGGSSGVDDVILCTYTPGGWGTACSGNNPGCVRDRGFPIAFPNGLVVGVGNTITLTSSAAVQAFLPQGGTPGPLTEDLVDPTSSPAGVLAGHLTAVKLAVGLGDAGLMPEPTSVGDLRLVGGAFDGLTVRELVALADRAIGGDEDALGGRSYSQLTDALTGINERFVECRAL